MTDAERKLWSHLRRNQMHVHFRRQVPFDQYVLDFYCHKVKLLIEVDGGQHYSEEGVERDKLRDSYLQAHGLHVLRFSDHDVLQNTDAVLNKIHEQVSHRLELI